MPINLQSSPTGTTGLLKKDNSRRGSLRRMPTNSRPPLSHRIRASFEGRRKSQDSPHTKHESFSGSNPTDPEILRHAIDQAIAGDAFQAGIASHIAKLLKPEIKTALDTIEPLVNAVLQHEILLKKTNASVEHVLLRLESMTDEEGAVDLSKGGLSVDGTLTPLPISDPQSEGSSQPISHTSSGTPGSSSNEQPRPPFNRDVTYTAGKLSEISNSLDLHDDKLGKVLEGIAEVKNVLISNECFDSLKESSEKNATTTSVIQAQLDQLQENVRVIITRIGTDLGTNVKAINDHLVGGKSEPETTTAPPNSSERDVEIRQVISSELEILKGNVEAGTTSHNENLAQLKTQIATLQSTLDEQKVLLGEIKETDHSTEVLAGIQKSNESHDAHSVILGELKEKNIQPPTLDDISTQSTPDAETLQILLTEVQKSNESHEKHAAALESLQSMTNSTETILAEIHKSHEELGKNRDALEEIRTKDFPAADLGEITKVLEAHTAALEEIKSKGFPAADFSPITSLLEAHTATLEEIKTKDVAVQGGIDAGAFDGHFGSITSLLEGHTAALEEIKSRDIPAADFGPITSLLEGHTAALDEIKAKDVPAADFSPITSLLKAHTATLEEIKVKDIPAADFSPVTSLLEAHTATLDEIKSKDVPATDFSPITAMLESHTALLDEIKAKDIPTTDFGPITSLLETHTVALDEIKAKDGAPSIDFGPITAILENHTAALEEIKSKDVPVADFSSITSTLESHRAVLEDIKSKDVQSSIVPAAINMEALEPHFNSITGMLEAHKVALDEIKSKDGSSSSTPAEMNTEALDKHFGSIISMLEVHTTALDEIKSKDITPNTGPMDINTGAFDGHSLTSMLESHTLALDELKSKNNDSSSSMPRSESTGFESFEPHVTGIKSALDAHMVVLGDIKSEILSKIDTGAVVADNMLEPHIIAIKSTLDTQTALLEEVKSHTSSPNMTGSSEETVKDSLPMILETLSSHTNLLSEIKNADVSDEILTALHELKESISTAIDSLKESDVSDEILTALHTCNDSQERLDKSFSALQMAINTSSEHNAQKSIEPTEDPQSLASIPIPAIDLTGLETQISTVIASLEGQNAVLGEIKDATVASNDSNTANGTLLAEIKDAVGASNESHNSHTATLGEIRDATTSSNESHASHASTLGEIKDAVIASNESHNSHTATLAEIKENTMNTITLGEIMEANTLNTVTLGEIKDATASSNDAHHSHIATLGELKDAVLASNESHTSALADLKSIHETHTITLGEIKEGNGGNLIALGEIKDAVVASNESHVSHSDTLGEIKQAVLASNDSHTSHASILGEIKEANINHMTTLGEIKDATNASNEWHNSHTTTLSEIKDLTEPVKDINEVLSTHTGLLNDLRETNGSKHEEVRGDIEDLKKIVQETSSKHEENLSKHGELIKEHGSFASENHAGLGLKGTVAGLALGGIAGVGIMKAVGGEGEEDKVSDVAERVEEVPGVLTEEEKVPEEEEPEPVVESETPKEDDSPKELDQEYLVEEQVLDEPEVQPGIEVPVEDEKIVEEEVPVAQEPEPEVISTAPDVPMPESENDISTTPQPGPQTEPELEPEISIEKEVPIEEPIEEPGSELIPADSDASNEKAGVEVDEKEGGEKGEVVEGAVDVLDVEEAAMEEEEPQKPEPETAIEEAEIVETKPSMEESEAQKAESDPTIEEEPQTQIPEPESEQDPTPQPEEDIITESSMERGEGEGDGGRESENPTVVVEDEKVPVEEEIVEVEGAKEGTNGESTGAEVRGAGEGGVLAAADDLDLKPVEEEVPVPVLEVKEEVEGAKEAKQEEEIVSEIIPEKEEESRPAEEIETETDTEEFKTENDVLTLMDSENPQIKIDESDDILLKMNGNEKEKENENEEEIPIPVLSNPATTMKTENSIPKPNSETETETLTVMETKEIPSESESDIIESSSRGSPPVVEEMKENIENRDGNAKQIPLKDDQIQVLESESNDHEQVQVPVESGEIYVESGSELEPDVKEPIIEEPVIKEPVIEELENTKTRTSSSPLSNEENTVNGMTREEIVQEPEVENEIENDNPMDISESIEEVQSVADDEEKPILIDEQIIEAPSEKQALGSESLVPEPAISQGAEDIKARDEIIVLKEMSKILTEEEENGDGPMVEEKNKSENVNDALVEPEITSGNEPLDQEVEDLFIKESIDIEDEDEQPEPESSIETRTRSQEISAEGSAIGDVLVHKLEKGLEEEPVKGQKEDRNVILPMIGNDKERSSESKREPNPKVETIENPIILTSTSLHEEEISPDEPEIEMEMKIENMTDELLQREDIIPANNDKLDVSENRKRILGKELSKSDEEMESEKKKENPSEGFKNMDGRVLEEKVIREEAQPIARQPENVADGSYECAPLAHGEYVSREEVEVEVPITTEQDDLDCGNLNASHDPVLPIDIGELGYGNLPVQVEPEFPQGFESEGQEVPDQSVIESIGTKEENILEDSAVQQSSAIKLEYTSEIYPDASVKGGNQELNDEISAVEHLKVVDTESSLEEYSKDTGIKMEMEDEESFPVKSKTVHENENFDDQNEVETQSKSLVPPNSSDVFGSHQTVGDMITIEDRTPGLPIEHVAEVQVNKGTEHHNEAIRDNITYESNENPFLSYLAQEEPVRLEEEEEEEEDPRIRFQPATAQDTIQNASYQNSEFDRNILKEGGFAETASFTTPDRNQLEFASGTISSVMRGVEGNEYISASEENVPRSLGLDPVLGSNESVVIEDDENTAQDISRDQFQREIFREGKPEPQPHLSIKDFPASLESSRRMEETIPLRDNILHLPSTESQSSVMGTKPMPIPMENQAVEENRNISNEMSTVTGVDLMDGLGLTFDDSTSIYSQDADQDVELNSKSEHKQPIDGNGDGDTRETPNLYEKFSSYEEFPSDTQTRDFSNYQDTFAGRLESQKVPVLVPKDSSFDSRASYSAGANFSAPESHLTSEGKYSSFAETRLGVGNSWDYQDHSEKLETESQPVTVAPRFNSRDSHRSNEVCFSNPDWAPAQRYSKYGENPFDTQASFGYKIDNREKLEKIEKVELETKTTSGYDRSGFPKDRDRFSNPSYPTQESFFNEPKSAPGLGYSSYGETLPLDTRTSFGYQRHNSDKLQPETKTTGGYDRSGFPQGHDRFSNPPYPNQKSFNDLKSAPAQRYSSYGDTPLATRTPFSFHRDATEQLESEQKTTYDSRSSYQQSLFSEPSYPNQESFFNDTKLARDQPIARTDQIKYRDDVPIGPTEKVLTESFPAYDEFQQPAVSVSHRSNSSLPARNPDRGASNKTSASPELEFGNENKRTYPTHNLNDSEPFRSSTSASRSSSRLPIVSLGLKPVDMDTDRGTDGLGYSSQPQGVNFGLPLSTRWNESGSWSGSLHEEVAPGRKNENHKVQLGTERLPRPLSFGSSGSSRGFNLGAQAPLKESREREREREIEDLNNTGTQSLVKNRLGLFEGQGGGESSSSLDRRTTSTSIPRKVSRPIGTDSALDTVMGSGSTSESKSKSRESGKGNRKGKGKGKPFGRGYGDEE
ncbi:hypothetical protein NHQ30_008919 [Ciborinia camelliae]|nr:hypothetical protein NHQ30_008919 [Ciborinia camelliae]